MSFPRRLSRIIGLPPGPTLRSPYSLARRRSLSPPSNPPTPPARQDGALRGRSALLRVVCPHNPRGRPRRGGQEGHGRRDGSGRGRGRRGRQERCRCRGRVAVKNQSLYRNHVVSMEYYSCPCNLCPLIVISQQSRVICNASCELRYWEGKRADLSGKVHTEIHSRSFCLAPGLQQVT